MPVTGGDAQAVRVLPPQAVRGGGNALAPAPPGNGNAQSSHAGLLAQAPSSTNPMKRSRACFVAPSSSSPLVPPHDDDAAADDDDGGGDVDDVENHRHAARAKQSKVNATTRLAPAPPPSQQEPNLPLLLNHYVAQDIANVYKQNNVHTLHRWQAEALSQPGVLDGTHNLVYSAPTSGGKSLVAEILLVKRAMERPTKVSLVVLPFVSLCEEKAEHLEKVVHGANLKVQRAYSDLGGGGSALFDNANIVVCTIERANGIIQRLMASSDEEGKGMPRLATVVVDETHMVGEPSRGIMLEQMLAKLVWWRHYRSGKGGGGGGGGGSSNPNNNHLQIVAMSATIPNLDEFGRWLHPARVYKTDLRPVQLHRYLCDLSKNGTLWDVDGNLLERRIVGLKLEDRLNRLILEPWAEGHSALVFCNSKMNCEIEAKKLAERIRNHAEFRAATMLSKKTSAERQEVFDRRTKHAADLRIQNDKELASCVEQGCAWHHANLTRESRAIVERAYKQGAVSVLFATSTLAAGVNLPARRVIFREPFKAHAMQADCMLTPRDYLQMAGRAGRTGIDSLGEAYLCYTGKGKGCTFDNLQTLLKSAPDPVISTLRPDSDGRSRQMVAALHEVINGGVVQSREDLEQYLKCFLLTKQSSLPPKAHTTKGSVAAAGDGDGTHADPDVAMTPAAAPADGGTVPAASAEPPEPPIKVAAEFAFKHLIETKQVQVLHEGSVLDGTKLGKAAASSGVRPHDAVNVAKFLTAACDDGIVLLSHLEPIYLSLHGEPRASSIQQDHAIRLRDMLYRPGDKSHLPRGAVSVAKKHAPERVVEAIAAGRLSAKKKAEVEKTVAAFYYALALMELCMDSTRLAVIAEQYKIDKGILQELMGVSAKRCSMFERFADGIELKDLACVFGNAKKTVGLGAQPEVVQLMAVKYMTKPLAVALCRAGICSVSSLAHATPYLIQQAIKKIQGSAGPEPRRKAHQLQKHARKLFRAMEEENQRELDRLEEAMANMAEREVAVPAEAEEAEVEVEVQRNAPVASLGVRRLSASLPAVSHPRELSHGTGTTTTTTTASSDASESGMKSYDSGHVLSTADDLNWLVSLCESSPWFAFCLIVPPCRVLAVRALPGSGTLPSARRVSLDPTGPEAGPSSPPSVEADEVASHEPEVHGLAVCVPEHAVYLVSATPAGSAGHDARQCIRRILRCQRPDGVPVPKVTFHLKPQLRAWLAHSGGVSPVTGAIDVRIAYALLDKENWTMPSAQESVFALEYVRSLFEALCKKEYGVGVCMVRRGVAYGRSGTPGFGALPDPQGWSAMLLAANIRGAWGKLLRENQIGVADLMTSNGVFATLQPLEMPVCNVLAEMEYRGILVDTAEMRRQLSDLDEKKRELLSSIRQLVPFRRVTENTLTVPRDLSTFLFHSEMGLGLEATGIPLTKTGFYSVSEANVAKVVGKHACVATVMHFRKLDTYQRHVRQLLGFSREYGKTCGMCNHHARYLRVRGHFLQSTGETGRIHMDNPNLQHLPKDVAYSHDPSADSRIASARACVVAPAGHVLMSADWRSMELRLLAHFSQDGVLLELLRDTGCDVFDALAARLETSRECAKQALYGVCYGMTPHGLAAALNVPLAQAEVIHDSLWATLPRLAAWKAEVEAEALKSGYVRTLLGRRRNIPMQAGAPAARLERAKRMAVNTVVQGSGADLLKLAMLKLHESSSATRVGARCANTEVQPGAPRTRLILVVHDEMIVECPSSEVAATAALLRDSMERAIPLSVPMPVRVRAGARWADLVEL